MFNRCRRLLLLGYLLGQGLGWSPLCGKGETPAVLLVANGRDAESVALARDYARRRGLPRDQVLFYGLPSDELITWEDFVRLLWNPLLKDLVERAWIEAIPSQVEDHLGRRRWVIQHHKIAHLVLFKGVPLRILEKAGLPERAIPVPMFRSPELQTNGASVDSELTQLVASLPVAQSCLPNPLFGVRKPVRSVEERVLKVARIDGPSYACAKSLYEAALEVEQWGLVGRAYIDAGGPYPEGAPWFETLAGLLEQAGFEVDIDREPKVLATSARLDGAAFYFGWYTGQLEGPFVLPGFRLERGALGFHLHSYSGATLRDPRQGWCAPLLAQGAAATLGNVAEPYLLLTQRPDLFLQALADGACLGDAAYFATPVLSWQTLVLGDPLYRPFKVTFEAQWASREQYSARQRAYLTLRRMKQLEQRGEAQGALEVGLYELADSPSVALAYEVARRLAKEGKKTEAARTLKFLDYLDCEEAREWGLLFNCAVLLEQLGELPASERLRAKLNQKYPFEPKAR